MKRKKEHKPIKDTFDGVIDALLGIGKKIKVKVDKDSDKKDDNTENRDKN